MEGKKGTVERMEILIINKGQFMTVNLLCERLEYKIDVIKCKIKHRFLVVDYCMGKP